MTTVSYTSKFQSMCDIAIANVESVNNSQVDTLVASGAVTLDIRDPDEHSIDHLKGGIHLSRGKLEMCIEKTIPDLNTTILTYCNANNRGALSAYSLKQMGYVNAKYIAGGLKGYRAQALAVNPMNL
jgi:rhodanese-related sulfurtransferase